MTRTRIAPALGLSAAWLLPLALSGCHESVVSPPGDPSITLSAMWPNDDGRWWRYRVVERSWDDNAWTTYPSPGAVPPAPTMSEVAALLDNPPAAVPTRVDSSRYELRFSGTITTLSGVTRQNLLETWILPNGPAGARSGQAAFLSQLAKARPDLRARIRARFASLAPVEDTLHFIYASDLLHGYAWEKTPQWIGTYGDLDTLLAWKYLTSRLSPGSEFTHQLVPALTSDVWLHGRILEPRTVRTAAGTFTNAVVCAYLIDFGVTTVTDDSGNPTGYTRQFSFGYVAYVPYVGPVACYERRMLAVGGISLGWGDVTLDLTARSLPPVALGWD
jgi:hypothetical protein